MKEEVGDQKLIKEGSGSTENENYHYLDQSRGSAGA